MKESPPGRIDRRIYGVGRHHTVDPGPYGRGKRDEILMETVHALIGYDRGKMVRVQLSAPQSREMLCGRGNSVCLERFDPERSEVRYYRRSSAKRARPHKVLSLIGDNVENGGEVYLYPDLPEVGRAFRGPMANSLRALPGKLACRGNRGKVGHEPLDAAAFLIDGKEDRTPEFLQRKGLCGCNKIFSTVPGPRCFF